ncbi:MULTISPECIES: RNA polymerase sigma factor [Amycolatopsis]|uniref:RNA polymerase sigma factor (Sigma-70 family) n=1 Tax=Amycolatopsis thermoflava TaxID=84480 RepID=A0A3N2GTC1_9PSEU|nr:sigma-70 family RNA polymerase sigma factor [Amycolatopsis thermoflava]ROS39902.1 RNA polymerase sigma factor (sigma-70 family) [Amycolatopsis thermoflava]
MGDTATRELAGMSDDDLLGEARGGDREAFAVLVRRHQAAVLRYASSVARCPADAQDLTADALVRTMLALEGGGGPATNFPAYLRTTVRRLAIDLGARNGRAVAAGLSPVIVEPRTPSLDEQLEGDRNLAEAFTALPARWRQVLWMVEVLGHRPQDVAAELGIAPAAACSLLWRARTALRRQYELLASRDS